MAVSGSWDPILRPGYFEVNVSVDMDWRRRGLGKKLYAEVVKFCSEHQAVALQTMIGETQHEGIAWAERRGFTKELHTFTSELDLSRFQPNVLMDSPSTAEANGFRFTSLAGYPQDDESFRRFADFYWDLVLDVPGMEEKPRPSFEEMKRVFLDAAIWDPEGVILCLDGHQWAAMSFVIKRSADVYYHNLTGVHRDYRGRGLALAIKLKAAAYAKQQGAKSILTHNDSTNARMLTVNQKMGYERKPGLYQLVNKM